MIVVFKMGITLDRPTVCILTILATLSPCPTYNGAYSYPTPTDGLKRRHITLPEQKRTKEWPTKRSLCLMSLRTLSRLPAPQLARILDVASVEELDFCLTDGQKMAVVLKIMDGPWDVGPIAEEQNPPLWYEILPPSFWSSIPLSRFQKGLEGYLRHSKEGNPSPAALHLPREYPLNVGQEMLFVSHAVAESVEFRESSLWDATGSYYAQENLLLLMGEASANCNSINDRRLKRACNFTKEVGMVAAALSEIQNFLTDLIEGNKYPLVLVRRYGAHDKTILSDVDTDRFLREDTRWTTAAENNGESFKKIIEVKMALPRFAQIYGSTDDSDVLESLLSNAIAHFGPVESWSPEVVECLAETSLIISKDVLTKVNPVSLQSGFKRWQRNLKEDRLKMRNLNPFYSSNNLRSYSKNFSANYLTLAVYHHFYNQSDFTDINRVQSPKRTSKLPENEQRTNDTISHMQKRSTPLESQNMPIILMFQAFYLYHTAILLASRKLSDDTLSEEDAQQLRQILSTQMPGFYEKVKDIVGDVSIAQGQKATFVILNGILNEENSRELNVELIKHQLMVTKQIIILLKMSPSDFGIDVKNPVIGQRVMEYLFKWLPHLASNSSRYVRAVNFLYKEMRSMLSQMAHRGDLSAKQTIGAKRIINELNKHSVSAMVSLLNIESTTMTPEELIASIKLKHEQGILDSEVELKIQQVVYFKKLEAVYELIHLLELEKDTVNIPSTIPQDLIDLVFYSDNGIDINNVQLLPKNQMPNLDGCTMDKADSRKNFNHSEEQLYNAIMRQQINQEFFCMSCFHRAYLKWQQENGIISRDDEQFSKEAPPNRRDLTDTSKSQILNSPSGDHVMIYDTLADLVLDDLYVPLEEESSNPLESSDISTSDELETSTGSSTINKLLNDKLESISAEDLEPSLGIVLQLYQRANQIVADSSVTLMQKAAISEITDNLKNTFYRQFPMVLGDNNFHTIDKPYGILIYGTAEGDHKAHKVINNHVARYHLKVVKAIVDTLELTRQDFEINKIPATIGDYLFSNNNTLDPAQIDALIALYKHIKATVTSRYEEGMLNIQQLDAAKEVIVKITQEKTRKICQLLGLAENCKVSKEKENEVQILLNNKNALADTQTYKLVMLEYDFLMKASKELTHIFDIEMPDLSRSLHHPIINQRERRAATGEPLTCKQLRLMRMDQLALDHDSCQSMDATELVECLDVFTLPNECISQRIKTQVLSQMQHHTLDMTMAELLVLLSTKDIDIARQVYELGVPIIDLAWSLAILDKNCYISMPIDNEERSCDVLHKWFTSFGGESQQSDTKREEKIGTVTAALISTLSCTEELNTGNGTNAIRITHGSNNYALSLHDTTLLRQFINVVLQTKERCR